MKNQFKKTIVVLAMVLLGMTCFAAEPGQKLLGKVKSNEYVVTQECDNVFTAWVQKPRLTFTNETMDFTTTKDLFLIGGYSFQYWLDDALAPVKADILQFKAQTTENVERLDAKDRELSSQITQLQEADVALGRRIDETTATLNQRIDDTSANLNRKIDDADATLNRKIDDVNTNLNQKINTSVAELNQRIDNTNTDLETFKSSTVETINGIHQTIAQDERNLTMVSGRVDRVVRDLSRFKTQTTNSITQLKIKTSELNERVDANKSEFNGFCAATTNKIRSINREISSIKSNVSELTGNFAYTSNKVERIATEYVHTESDPTVPAWAKVETPPYLTSYTETDPGFYEWIGRDTLEFSNNTIKFLPNTAHFYVGGYTLQWWLEQSVVPVTTELREYKTTVGNELSRLTAKDTELGNNLSDLNSRYNAFNLQTVNDITLLQAADSRLGNAVANINERLDDMRRDILGFQSGLDLLTSNFMDFKVYTTNNIARLDAADEALDVRIDNANVSFETFKTETTNNIARLNSADEALGVRIDNANTAFDAFKTETTNNVARLDAKDAELDTKIDNANNALNQRIDDTNTALDTFKTETTNALARLNAKDSETTGNLENLSNQVAKVESDLGFTSNRVEEIYGDYVKLSDLQDGIRFNTMEVTNLTVNGTPVAVKTDVSSATNAMYQTITNEFVRMADLQEGIAFNTMEVTNLTVNGQQVALEKHKHDVSDVTNLVETLAAATNGVMREIVSATNSIYQTMTNEFVKLEDLQAGITFDNMEVTNLTVNGKQVSLEGHKHVVEDITDLKGLWSIPGADVAASNAIDKIERAQNMQQVQEAMVEFLQNFRKPPTP